ncbi:YdeI/OmpD-associated family protein [Paenibacillus sp. YIM B09110]|uniref:YdeI/OmpD-associated family protein n=1 Tax=Paenibacillus sp. YIM B09110 TaxID=3126102 RepID=UPI00301B81D9
MIIDNIVRADNRQDWRNWLNDNHQAEDYCWVLTADYSSNYVDFVEEALCYGWIDSTKKMYDKKTAQRFSPRRKKSNWTELNKERVRRLEKLGLMTEAGRKVLPDMSAEAFVVHEDIWALLREDEVLYANFQGMPDLYKRIRIDNIQSVRHDAALFQNRLTKFIEHTRNNKMYGQWNDKERLIQY